MAITKEMLKSLQQDYLLARFENGEITMEPVCSCGNSLEEDYYCSACDRECECTMIACEDPQALNIADKLVSGNPNFRNFKAALLDK